jgi:hypothetical protein
MQLHQYQQKPLSQKLSYYLFCIFALLFALIISTGKVSASGAPDFTNCPPEVQVQYQQALRGRSYNQLSEVEKKRLDGTYVVGKDNNGQPIFLSCADPGSALEKLGIRLITLITSVVGLVFGFSVSKSAIVMMISGANAEQFQAAVGGLKTGIFGVVGVLLSYQIIIFILVGFVGFGAQGSKYNVICNNQLVFQLVFSDDKGNLVQPPACS